MQFTRNGLDDNVHDGFDCRLLDSFVKKLWRSFHVLSVNSTWCLRCFDVFAMRAVCQWGIKWLGSVLSRTYIHFHKTIMSSWDHYLLVWKLVMAPTMPLVTAVVYLWKKEFLWLEVFVTFDKFCCVCKYVYFLVMMSLCFTNWLSCWICYSAVSLCVCQHLEQPDNHHICWHACMISNMLSKSISVSDVFAMWQVKVWRSAETVFMFGA